MKQYLIVILALCFIQCKEDPTNYRIIKINSKDIQLATPLSCLFDSLKYIPLETTKFSIDKLCMDKMGNFYVLDQEGTNALYKFDSSGKFLHTIGSQGRGPEEYLSISDFSIFQDSLLDLYDDEQGKRLIFDLNGNCIESYTHIDKGTARFIHVADTIAYYVSCGGYAPNLAIQIQGEKYLFFKQDYSELLRKFEYFHLTENRLLYTDNYNDTIFYFDKGKLKPYIYIDFKRNKLPKKLRNNGQIARGHYCYNIDNIKITPSLMYFSFVYKNDVINAFIDLEQNKVLLTKVLSNDINGIPFLMTERTPNASDKIISHVSSHMLHNSYEYLQDSGQPISEDYKHLMRQVTLDSNPIIIFAYLKNNIVI